MTGDLYTLLRPDGLRAVAEAVAEAVDDPIVLLATADPRRGEWSWSLDYASSSYDHQQATPRAREADLWVEEYLALAWARAQVARRRRTEPRLRFGHGRGPMTPQARPEVLLGDALAGGVAFVGYAALDKVAPGIRDRVVALTRRAVEAARAAWEWEPAGLRLGLHKTGSAFGFALRPGTGVLYRERLVSLRWDYLQRWGDDAIYDTLVHEICHHYREETWPRTLASRTRKDLVREQHDERFCAELRKALPRVDSWRACAHELREPETDRERDFEARRAAGRERTARASAAVETEVNWSPGAGVVVFDAENMTLAWRPRSPRRQRWRPVVRDIVSHGEGALSFFAMSFDPAAWGSVQVEISDDAGDVYVHADNFRDLVRWMIDQRIMARADDEVVTPRLRRSERSHEEG